MKKITCSMVLIMYCCLLSAQDQDSSFNCSDLHEKLVIIKNTFDKLETYKKELLKDFGSQKVYSTNFKICDHDGKLSISKGDTASQIQLNFTFDRTNTSDHELQQKHSDVLLKELKKVFSNWDEERSAEDHGNLNIIELMEKGYYKARIKREIILTLNRYYNDDYSINLEFNWKNY